MKSRVTVIITALALISLLLGSMQAGASTNAAPPQPSKAQLEAKMDARLVSQLHTQGSGGAVKYMVYLGATADTRNNISPLNWAEKGYYVYNQLRETANRTQPAVQASLNSLSANGKVSKVQSFWAVNGFYVEGSADSAYALAARGDVANLRAITTYHVDETEAAPLTSPISAPEVTTSTGIPRINAPQVWALGYLGQGVTVGSIDTGVQVDHPALIDHYRGTSLLPGNDHNWFDAIRGETAPLDDDAHGTHTTGTMVGLDAAGQNVIGVAPQANFIACRGLAELGGTVNELLTCGQFMLAPTDVHGNNPRPELRPNVVNNSWGGDDGLDPAFERVVQEWIDAGIFPAFSNGNDGPGAYTVGSPGSLPEVFSAGATNPTNDVIAGFSSRGPSPIDEGLKPNASAPGANIRSSIPPNAYALYSGTSMASPHMAGAVALLLSKNRGLTVNDLKNVITSTAYFSTFMGTRPNNTYGWGRLDVLAGIQSINPYAGTVTGQVSDGVNPIGGASVTWADNSGYANATTVSDASGTYTLTLAPGFQTLRAERTGYGQQDAVVNVMNGMTVTQNFTLSLQTQGSVSGTLRLANDNSPLSGSILISVDSDVYSTTIFSGNYNVALPNGEYDVTFRPADNCLAPQTAHVTVNGATTHNFSISPKADNFGYTCQEATISTWITATNVVSPFQRSPYAPSYDPRYDGSYTTTLPFSFRYYGQDYTDFHINTDGYAYFGGPPIWSEGGNIPPHPALPNATMFVGNDDLDLTIHNGDVYTEVVGSAPNRQFVIEWLHQAAYVEPNSDYTFEIVLDEATHSVTFQYLDITWGVRDRDRLIVGIEDEQGTTGIAHSFNYPGAIRSGLKITWLPPSTEPTPTVTPGGPTFTPAATQTPMMTDTPVPTITPTDCPNPFVDLNGNIFYPAIHFLYCRGVVGGTDPTHYTPAGTATRAQFAKVVVLGFAIESYTPLGGTPDFTDVPNSYFAYAYIEAGYHAGILSGYDAATCTAIGQAYPCYGPNRPITRAQLTKLVVAAGGFSLFTPTSGQTFTDVGPNNVFFTYIETAHHYGIINGYPDNTFRPNNNIRRDEMAQIVYKGITTPPLR